MKVLCINDINIAPYFIKGVDYEYKTTLCMVTGRRIYLVDGRIIEWHEFNNKFITLTKEQFRDIQIDKILK